MVGGLGGETKRWKATALQLEQDHANIVGNVLLSTTSVVYLGAFTAEFRSQLLTRWIKRCVGLKIPVDTSFRYTL